MSESPAVTPATDTPNETELLKLIRIAVGDPGSVVPRAEALNADPATGTGYESVSNWSARAVLASVAPRLTAALRDEVGRLRTERDEARAEVKHLTRLHDERDAIERQRSIGNRDVMAGALSEFAVELRQRGNERAQIGDDDHAEDEADDEDPCEEHDPATCHVDAAVATWMRAATLAETRAAALRGGA